MSRPLQDGQVLDFVPARPAGPRLLPDHDESRWLPGDAGVLPEPVLGAAVPLLRGGEPVTLGVVEHLQPRAAFTLSWWVTCDWAPTLQELDERGWEPEPNRPPPTDGGPLIDVRMVRTRARRTRVRVRVGADHIDATVDLDTPLAHETPRDDGASNWHHLAATFGGADLVMTLFLDGVAVASRAATSPHLDYARNPRVAVVGDTGPRKILWLGPVRLHDHVRPTADLVAERYHDRATYPTLDQRNPLAFRLADEQDEAAIYITDDDVVGRPLHLVVENRGRFPVELPRAPRGADPDGFLDFRFRPGCLYGGARHWVEPHAPAWRVEVDQHADGVTSLLVGRVEPLTLIPGQSAAVTLQHVRADGALGAHGTHVELVYRHPHHPRLTSTRVNAAEVRGRRGRRVSPLRFAVLGEQTVVNDERANTVRLSLINTSHHRTVELSPPVRGDGTRLTLTFDSGQPGQDWALATPDQLLGAVMDVEGPGPWRTEVEVLGERPQWVLTPAREQQLAPGEELTIVIEGLRTSMAGGDSRADLSVENLPGYWDDDFHTEIRKSRVVEEPEGAGLEVEGDLVVRGSLSVDGVGLHLSEGDLSVGGGDLRVEGTVSDRHGELLPGGVIVMWHGSAADVPAGWVLCDGTHDAPDLRDRFIRGTSHPPATAWGRQGGHDEVTLSIPHMPAHSHEVFVDHTEVATDALRNAGDARTAPRFDTLHPRPAVVTVHEHAKLVGLAHLEYSHHREDLTARVQRLAEWVLQRAAASSDVHSISYLTDTTGTPSSVGGSGSGVAFDNRPAFYDLCFIMKRIDTEGG